MDYARIDCAMSNGLFIAACNFCRGHGAQYQCYSYMDCCYSTLNQCKLEAGRAAGHHLVTGRTDGEYNRCQRNHSGHRIN